MSAGELDHVSEGESDTGSDAGKHENMEEYEDAMACHWCEEVIHAVSK